MRRLKIQFERAAKHLVRDMQRAMMSRWNSEIMNKRSEGGFARRLFFYHTAVGGVKQIPLVL